MPAHYTHCRLPHPSSHPTPSSHPQLPPSPLPLIPPPVPQSLRSAALAEQDRLRAQWQLEMEVREKRALQSTVDLERRLEDAMGALKHERAEAAREKQMRVDADEAVEDMQVGGLGSHAM